MSGYEGTHQDWLEGQADDQIQREAFERDGRRWAVSTSAFAFKDIIIRVGGVGVFEFTQDEAVRFANAILSEVEIAQLPAPQPDDAPTFDEVEAAGLDGTLRDQ